MEEINIDFSDDGNWREYEGCLPVFAVMHILNQTKLEMITEQAEALLGYSGKLSYDEDLDKVVFELVKKEDVNDGLVDSLSLPKLEENK